MKDFHFDISKFNGKRSFKTKSFVVKAVSFTAAYDHVLETWKGWEINQAWVVT